MKKIFVLAALILFVTPFTVFAQEPEPPTATSTYSLGTDGKMTLGTSDVATENLVIGISNGVLMAYEAGTDGVSYVIGTHHQAGTRTYGSSSGDTNLFFNEDDALGAALPDPPATGTESAGFDGNWQAQ